MKCKNCNSDMEFLIRTKEGAIGRQIHWCSECGAVFYLDLISETQKEEELWVFPKIVDNIKRVVSELMRVRKSAYGVTQHLNRTSKEELDKIEWGEDDRR